MTEPLRAIRYEPLTAGDEAALHADRDFVPAVVEARFPAQQITGTEADLALFQRILEAGPYTDEIEAEAVALGTALGDLIARASGMTWVRYSDEEGVDLALRYEHTSIVVFPRSMIQKRLERAERPDLADIYSQVCSEVKKLIESQGMAH